jgi:LmbE family N-acetylglucosaminyl deacetylase
MPLTRRTLLAAVPGISALAAPPAPRKVVVAGGHPGDPECGCAGTIARLSDRGDDVVVLYLNRGEGYCGGAPLARCADIRTTEAREACRILKARPVFDNQYDGRAIVDPEHYASFNRLLAAENPDLVLTQWPIDRHRDHRAISLLTLDAWLSAGRSFALYYYEVAEDTMMFSPAEFVDISAVETRRRAACYAHSSQQPGKWYPLQTEITSRNGVRAGAAQAEGFLRHPDSKPFPFP